jgi:hypothetical protein
MSVLRPLRPLAILLLAALPLAAQKPAAKKAPAAAPAADSTPPDSLSRFLASFPYRALGPAAYSGRVTSIAVEHGTPPQDVLYRRRRRRRLEDD